MSATNILTGAAVLSVAPLSERKCLQDQLPDLINLNWH